MTYSALARKVRVDRRTIIRLVARLRAAGLLEQKPGQNGRPNEFTVLVPWARRTGDNLSPVRSGRLVTDSAGPVTAEARTGDIADDQSSYRRIDVVTSSSSEVADAPLRGDVKRLLDLLDEEIERNGGRRPSRSKKNIDAARLLLDRDGKTAEQVEAAIRWCQSDEFWRANILSMSKLREKYETLRLQAARSGHVGAVEAGREADAMLRARAQQAVAS